MTKQTTDRLLYFLPFILINIPYLQGMMLDVMDIDSSQYAAISKEMYETGSYLQVFDRGRDYLDKPPLLFWFSSFMYSIFGVSHFVFRLAPFLSTWLGVYATYRVTTLYYGNRAGYLAALMISSCQAFLLMNHDVRTDTMLTAFTITAIWQLAEYFQQKKLSNLLLGFFCMGLAMLAKGPIGLMVPVLGFAAHFFVRKEWSAFFDYRYLLGLLVIALVLLPMCIGLYQQFDAHPDRHESGLYFYFWKQSFGRITGENQWNNNPHLTFLSENFLWNFLPWTLLFFPAFYQRIKKAVSVLFNKEEKNKEEFFSVFGFLLPLVALSMSKYQLPHYIYVIMPLSAVVTGAYIAKMESNLQRLNLWKGLQLFASFFLLAVVSLIVFFAFPNPVWYIVLLVLLAFLASFYFFFKGKSFFEKIILSSFFVILGTNILLNGHLYPTLFTYQSGSVIGRFVKNNAEIDKNKFFIYGEDLHFYAIDFYSDVRAKDFMTFEEIKTEVVKGKIWLYTDEKGFKELQNADDLSAKTLHTTPRFHVSTLNAEFLNPATRASACVPVYLLEIEKK